MNKNKIKNQKSIKNFFLSPFSFYLKFIFTFFLLTSLSCDKSTKPETVTFSGTVTLEDESDFSGVKVFLYKPVELDTALVRINQQYPQIGVQISQETEFDHREHSPLHSTTTNASGTWKIESVTPGTYNVVAEKDSFGWEYKYEASGSGIDLDTLYHALYLTGLISSSITAKEKQFLIIEDDVSFANNAELKLEGANTILIYPNKKISIQGPLNINLQKKLFITSYDIDNPGRGLVIDTDGQFIFNNLTVSHLSQGILFETFSNLNGEISNSIFKKCSIIGIYAKNDSISIENNIFVDFDSYSIECLNNFSIQKNIFLDSKGILLRDGNGVVENNLFSSNEIAITPYKGQINIKNNDFDSNIISIAVNSSDCQIEFNNFFKNNIDIELNKNYVQQSYDYSDPHIENNNFYTSDTAITIWGKNSIYGGGLITLGVGIDKNIDGINCYWNSTIEFEIDKKIIDIKDGSRYLHYIFYIPFQNSAIQSAGIIN